MTSLGLQWLQYTESKRANMAKEALSHDQNEETKRHNIETERMNVMSLDEAVRSHKASEAIQSQSNTIRLQELAESQRKTDLSSMANTLSQAEAWKHHAIAQDGKYDAKDAATGVAGGMYNIADRLLGAFTSVVSLKKTI